jgi:hypothetical protein
MKQRTFTPGSTAPSDGCRRLARRWLPAAIALSGTAAGVVVGLSAAGPAAAAAGDITCTAQAQLNFSPPLSAANPTASVSGSGALTNCFSLTGFTNYKSASLTDFKGTATVSKLLPGGGVCGLLFSATGTITDVWDPVHATSRVNYTVSTDPIAPGSIRIAVKVVSGAFAGDSATLASVITPNVDCAVKGLSSLTFDAAVVTFG